MAHPDGEVRRERRGNVLVVTIDRSDKVNSFTPKMMGEFVDALEELEREGELRCGLVCSEGKHFTAGLDLPKFRDMQMRGEPVFPRGRLDPADLRDPRRTKPLVYAVKGICFTLGIELMLAGDVVVAASDCRFGQIEVKRGIMPGAGGTFRFVERGGWGNAMRYLLTGDEFGADEAYRMHFVQQVVAPGQEFDAAFGIAERIATQAPLAVVASRQNALRALEHGPRAAIDDLNGLRRMLSNSEDAKEGVASFVEKRPAKFTGR
jgi:enoyl-CoA hydratase/carnithine racemase